MRLARALHQSANEASEESLPFPRTTVETFALDSFQNVLFSLIRFYEYTGRWPDGITVIVRPRR